MQGDGRVGRWLRLVHQAQSRATDFEQSYALTSAQFSVLSAVVSSPGLDQRGVSAMTFLDKSTVTAVLNRLVERRLVVAERSARDGRRDHLEPSRTAIALLYDATPQLMARNETFMAVLPAALRADFLETLETVGHTGRAEPPSRYRIPSPEGTRPPLDVTWGLGRLLRAAVQRYGQLWSARIPSITLVQWLALRTLSEVPDLDQRALGEMISLDKATASVLLGRLLSRELIRKVSDDADRRRRILNLTQAGSRLVDELHPEVLVVDESFLAPLDELERTTFLDGLRVLAETPARIDQTAATPDIAAAT